MTARTRRRLERVGLNPEQLLVYVAETARDRMGQSMRRGGSPRFFESMGASLLQSFDQITAHGETEYRSLVRRLFGES